MAGHGAGRRVARRRKGAPGTQVPGAPFGSDPARLRPDLARAGGAAPGGADSEAVARGVRWLADTQREDGSWDEPYFTGTG
ncbi:hypothetical protein ABTW94_28940, partial [Streptomyces griseoluteus]